VGKLKKEVHNVPGLNEKKKILGERGRVGCGKKGEKKVGRGCKGDTDAPTKGGGGGFLLHAKERGTTTYSHPDQIKNKQQRGEEEEIGRSSDRWWWWLRFGGEEGGFLETKPVVRVKRIS